MGWGRFHSLHAALLPSNESPFWLACPDPTDPRYPFALDTELDPRSFPSPSSLSSSRNPSSMGEISDRSRSVMLMPKGSLMSCRGEMEVDLLWARTGRAVVEGIKVRIKLRRRMLRLEWCEGRIVARGCRLMLMRVYFLVWEETVVSKSG